MGHVHLVDNKKWAVGFVTSALLAFSSVYIARVGYYSHCDVAYVLAASAIAALGAPSLRRWTVGAAVLVLGTILLLAFLNIAPSGAIAYWGIWQVMPGSLFWLPVFTVALVTQLAGLLLAPVIIRPASAVAAAAFLAIPAAMSDVLTGYEHPLPSICAVIALLAGSLLRFRRRLLWYVWAAVEPVLIVLAGWCAVLLIGYSDYVRGDVRWLVTLLGFPCAVAAIFTNILDRRSPRAGTSARRPA